ncbi:MAG TPA: cytochrome b [Xanthobacteraceae bacterium]|jgi:cytochrome b561
MNDGNAPAAYSLTARALHWITAALVLTTIPIGIVMANERAGPLQDFLYNLHRSIGTAIIPLVIVRLGYRLTHPPLPLPDDIPPIQQLAAHATHWGLYTLLVMQPFVGWVATSAYGAPIMVFGLFQLPPIWPQDQPFSDRLFLVHQLIGLAIACLAIVHIGAALYHHFVRKDQVLKRMITR